MATKSQASAMLQLKLLQEKMKSEKAKTKIYSHFSNRLAEILSRYETRGTNGSSFADMLSSRSSKDKYAMRAQRRTQKVIKRKPPSRKQLMALARGRKVLKARRKSR